MAKKPYSPVAPYSDLVAVETMLEQATSVDEVRKIVVSHGPKIGYKAFCYIARRADDGSSNENRMKLALKPPGLSNPVRLKLLWACIKPLLPTTRSIL